MRDENSRDVLTQTSHEALVGNVREGILWFSNGIGRLIDVSHGNGPILFKAQGFLRNGRQYRTIAYDKSLVAVLGRRKSSHFSYFTLRSKIKLTIHPRTRNKMYSMLPPSLLPKKDVRDCENKKQWPFINYFAVFRNFIMFCYKIFCWVGRKRSFSVFGSLVKMIESGETGGKFIHGDREL